MPRIASRLLSGVLLFNTLVVICAGVSRAEEAKAPAAPRLIVEPAEIELTGAHQRVQLLVTLVLADGTQRDVTRQAAYLPANAKLVTIASGQLLPVADGQTQLKVEYKDPKLGTLTAEAKLTVQQFAAPRNVHFENDIVPLLTKLACNSGGCHGKAGGQNGFKLSLLGDDPNFDFDALTRQARGRRLFPAVPERSLLLLKAIGAVPHGGGARMNVDSDNYELLLDWIKSGAAWGDKNAPTVDRIEVTPKERLIREGGEQQLRVIAHFTDGSRRDVTGEAEYKSQKPDILEVEGTGLARTLGPTGESAVMVRYMGLVDVSVVGKPFGPALPDAAYAQFQPRGFIDELVMKKWRKLGIAPSPAADDETFIRRAYLDAVGAMPSAEDVRAFVADASPDKREKLIDKILQHPSYADYWALQWGDMLRNKRRYGDGYKHGTFMFASWIRGSFAHNMPYDQFVREILTAQGTVSDNPAVVWYREVRNNVHLVNDTSQLFLGTRVSCANCHNHPYEKMSQDDYWAFAGFYSRLGKKEGEVANESSVYVKKDGGTNNPRTGKQLKPKGLWNGAEYEFVRGEDPRQNLVAWMTAPENPYFAKAIVNRMWAKLMGVGLVEAVDDMRATNPPTNPELLDSLAKDFVAHKYDLKHLIGQIMKSRAYGLSSTPIDSNKADRLNYARYYPRRLSAHVLLDAICQATDVPESFPGFPAGTRAQELPDEDVSSYFLDIFGRSQRETPCECETSSQPNLAQVLQLMNSSDMQSNKVASPKGRLAALVKANKSTEETVDELFLAALGRRPRADEKTDAANLIGSQPNKQQALEDLFWTLLNTKEFLFNH